MAGTETEGAKTTELLPNNFSDKELEGLRKAINEENLQKVMPRPTPGVQLNPEGAPSAFKPPAASMS